MTDGNVDQMMQIALQHHRAGRLREAEALYRKILAQQPNHASALHHLGVIAHQAGRHAAAVDLIRQAINLQPNRAAAHHNLGNALRAHGQIDQAIGAYRQCIALDANVFSAYDKLAVALQEKGQLDEAISVSRQGIALKPRDCAMHINLASALRDNGQTDAAIAAARQAIALDPNHPGAQLELANALKDKGQLDEAIVVYRHAIALKPTYFEAYSNLGNALRHNGQLDEAIVAHNHAVALKPNLPEALANLGNAMVARGQFDEAIATYLRAIALKPNYAKAHNNIAHALLTLGEFARGWDEYEWRWKCDDFPSPQKHFVHRMWDGKPLGDATLLLHTEQGFGDALQFIRYLPQVQQRCGKIILECQPELKVLFQHLAGNCQVVGRGQPLPAFDVQCPLLTLPRLFGTNLENIPREVPYLSADVVTVQKWKDRLANDSHSLNVGLVWAGRKTHTNDRNRSIGLPALARLGEIQGIHFYSLQKGESADQAANPPAGLQITDWTSELKDFADTAGMIANLDLVISVDTAVVHLAGAMGKPVWVMLPFVPDWRWLQQREDSPWYPTMRLFRQPAIGDWENVIQRVIEKLKVIAQVRRDASGPLSPVLGGEG